MAKAKSKAGNAAAATSGGPKLVETNGGYDPGRPGQHREITETSDSEPALEAHVVTVTNHADKLAAHWQDRVAKEGKIKWINPLAPKDSRVMHSTKAACQKEINQGFKKRAEMARLAKQPKDTYTPQSVLVEPQRTLVDYMGPKAAAMTLAAQQIAGSVQNLGVLGQHLAGRPTTAGMLMAMQESQAIARLGEVDDKELQNVVMKANFGGRVKLGRAAKKLAQSRGLEVLI